MLTIIDSDAAINKKASKIYIYFTGYLFFVEICETNFRILARIFIAISIISSHVVTESPIRLSKNLPFSGVHVVVGLWI